MQDLLALLPEAAALAKPPVSNFRVGAIARGGSGKLYYGTNLEFAGEALSFTVHAEQSAIVNAWMGDETGVDVVATSAAPCGYCRQFLNELVTARDLVIVMPHESRPLAELLPSSFGPRDLGIDGGLLQPHDHGLRTAESDELAQAALRAANMSYAPYSKSYAGVALRANDGRVFSGPYAENAAFNPSLSPLQAALSQLNLAGGSWKDIAEVVLAHADSLHTSATRTVLAAVAPGIRLRTVRVEGRDGQS